MKTTRALLLDVARILDADVSLVRRIILDSEGGELPSSIKKKQRLLREIDLLLKASSKK